MLTQLHIQNIAVIQKATIAFDAGFNVFTGETGAGKTILLSAIDAVLGERTSRDIIRTGEERAFVSALFEQIPEHARCILEQHGYEPEDGSVLISREMTEAGKNTCKINGMPATVAILREIAAPLIHIHGQRDSLQLLMPEKHIGMVDAFGDYALLLQSYQSAYERCKAAKRELESLRMDEAQKERRIDMLRYQIAEIEAAELEDENEEEQLQARRAIIRNSEKILEALARAYTALHGDEDAGGINDRFNGLANGVHTAAGFMEELSPMAQRLEEIGYELAEYANDLRGHLEGFEFNPRELDKIENRLEILHRLQKKYGGNIKAVIAFGQHIQEELEIISGAEQRIAQLTALYEKEEKELLAFGEELSGQRMGTAESLVGKVEDELAFLDMPAVRLSIRREKKPPAEDGMDEISFWIVTNVGEEPKPLAKIASGGEISRIMLAFKNVLAHRDEVGTLIFDEVDTGVSGRAAQKIGQKLAQVAQARQVICVTHLAQVAAFAGKHCLICKEVDEGRTFTRIAELGEQARAEELARISGGDTITEAALNSARELMERSRRALEP